MMPISSLALSTVNPPEQHELNIDFTHDKCFWRSRVRRTSISETSAFSTRIIGAKIRHKLEKRSPTAKSGLWVPSILSLEPLFREPAKPGFSCLAIR